MYAQALSVNSTRALAPGGAFDQAIPGFNPRESQQAFAQNFAQLIDSSGVLVAESGTGTGKTFAYLVPALLSGRKVVISTGTRHLQDQLFYRDLPVVSKTLNLSPDVALLKGRANYLCIFRLKQLAQDLDLSYLKGMTDKRHILDKWALKTAHGEIAEVSELDEQDPLWWQVTSTSDNCLGSECPEFKACFVNKARQRAMKSKLVVVNHHLFFSDLSLKEAGFGELLPDYEVVIFDEAHQLPDVATRFLGFTVSSFQIKELCRDIIVTEAKEKSGVALQEVVDMVQNCISPLHLNVSKHKRGPSQVLTQDAPCMASLNKLLDALAAMETSLSSAASAGDGLQRCHERTMQIQGHMLDWLEHSVRVDSLVCWFESSNATTRLNASPLSVREPMRDLLTQTGKTALLTSATLAAGDDFSYYLQRLGLDEVDTASYISPFDYSSHALLYLPTSMPEPHDKSFVDAMVESSQPVLKASQGRAFMLFTSYAMLHRVAQKMREVSEWQLLVQGQSPRAELIEQFRQAKEPVLLGTASFWEGVDIQGEDLSCVIIDKLPFAPPNDPVMSARLKQLEQAGGKPFFDVQVPDAVITLKQGAGRLIRDESDKGVLMICDPRILSKGYGAKFISALPPMRKTQRLDDVKAFFRNLK